MLAILDGIVTDAAEAHIPVTDEGLLRGDGVFEVIRLYGGRPFALDEHLRRMSSSAANLRLAIDLGAVRADVEALLERRPARSTPRCGSLVTRGGRRIGLLEELKDAARTRSRSRTITYAPTRVLDGVKSLSLRARTCSRRRLAKEQGADEALLVTPHGRVLEGADDARSSTRSTARRSYTPPLDEHILDSITRRHVSRSPDVDRAATTPRRSRRRHARRSWPRRCARCIPIHAIDGRELPPRRAR